MSVNTRIEWEFVIDTTQYAGNFEREMCAYITGAVGECGVGDAAAARFMEDYPEESPLGVSGDENLIARKPDDNGCWRPVGTCGQSLRIFLFKEPTEEQAQFMKTRALKWDGQPRQKVGVLACKVVRHEIVKTTAEREI